MKKEVGTKWQFQPHEELKYAGQMCEIIKNENCGIFDYYVKFNDGNSELVFEEELG